MIWTCFNEILFNVDGFLLNLSVLLFSVRREPPCWDQNTALTLKCIETILRQF